MSRIVLRFVLLLALGGLYAPAASLAAVTTTKAAAKSPLPWIEDDYARALATAKARKLPIFVESWAPW